MSGILQAITSFKAASAGGGGATSGNVTWTNALNMTTTSPDIFRSTGYYSRASSVESIDASAGHDVYFQFQPAAGDDRPGGVYTSVYLLPVSGGPYTSSTPDALAAFSGEAGHIRGNFGFYVYDSTNTFKAGVDAPLADTDVLRLGFDSSGHFFAKRNGSSVYTSTGTFSGTHLLYVVFNNEGGTNKLRNVSFQQ